MSSRSPQGASPLLHCPPPSPPEAPPALMDGVEADNPWTVLEGGVRYDTPWLRLVHYDVLTPAGTPGQYGVVVYKGWAGAVLAVDGEGRVPLVGQWRFAGDYYSWEVPQGGMPLDAAGRCDPVAGAQRELREETGYAADHWREILRMDMSSSVSTEHAVCYVAWGLHAGVSAPEEVEKLHVRHLRLRDVYDLIRSGVIRDAITIAMVQRLRLMHLDGDLPSDLAAAVGRGLA